MTLRLTAPTILILALTLPGCAAKTAFDLATSPVRNARDSVNAAGKAYDLLTTSQTESDARRGRTLRKYQNQLVKLDRRYRDQSEDCEDGDDDACDERHETWNEMERIRLYVPTIRY